MRSSRERPSRKQERNALGIFEAALDVDPAERLEFARKACENDATLFDRVRELLGVHADSAALDSIPAEGIQGTAVLHNPLEALLQARPEFARAIASGEPPLDTDSDVTSSRPVFDDSSRYRFEAEIARGGMGVVYRIWDSVLRRPLAMKVSRTRQRDDPISDSRARARVLEEAQVTGQLSHPGIVPLHDIGTDLNGRAYFTMHLVEGVHFGDVIRMVRDGDPKWTEERVVGVLVSVCETVAFAHAQGVIHRDLKPANVMVGSYGETFVMDWGLAKVVGSTDSRDLRVVEPTSPSSRVQTDRSDSDVDSPLHTADGSVVGTPAFMPPEQADRAGAALDQRSDIYAAGAMLYTLLAGAPPYSDTIQKASSHRVLSALRKGPPTSLGALVPDAAVELVAVCEKAMARTPKDRYGSMSELGDDLRAYLEQRVVRAHRTGPIVELRKWVSRNRATANSLAAILLMLIVGLAGSLVLLDRVQKQRDRADGALDLVTEEVDKKNAALTHAEATRLSAQSSSTLSDDPGLALMLAIEAQRLEDSGESRSSLHAALDALREERTLLGHNSTVKDVAFHPDGDIVASISGDYGIRLWDLSTGEKACLWGHTNQPFGLRFSPSGDVLASWGWNGRVLLWKGRTGEFIRELYRPREMNRAIHSVCFSPNGRLLASGALDGVVRVWRVNHYLGKAPRPLAGHGADVMIRDLTFSPDSRRLASASEDGTARIWDIIENRELFVLKSHGTPVATVDFNRDGTLLLTAGHDNRAIVWDTKTGREVLRLDGHSRWLTLAQFSPDGTRILTASIDGEVRVWDTASGRELAQLVGHNDSINDAVFSADGERIVTASTDRTSRIWLTETGAQLASLHGHRGTISSLAISLDGKRVATGSHDNTVRVWSADTRDEERRAREPSWDAQAIPSPDGRLVLSLAGGSQPQIREAKTGDVVSTLVGHESSILSVAFSRDSQRVVTGARSPDGTARVWDVQSGEQLAVFDNDDFQVDAVAFHPDGDLVAICGLHISMWSLSNQERIHNLPGHYWKISAATFSPDGSVLATAGTSGIARLTDTRSGDVRRNLRHSRGWLNAAIFSPDGRRLVTASTMNRMYVWDLSTGRRLAEIIGHDSDLLAAGFSDDLSFMVTSHANRSIHVWGLPAGTPWLQVRSPESRIHRVGFEGKASIWAESVTGQRVEWSMNPAAGAEQKLPRHRTPFDYERIAVGDAAERAQQLRAWERSAFEQKVSVSEEVVRRDPSFRKGLFTTAEILVQDVTRGLRYTKSPSPSPYEPSMAELCRRGIRVVEFAAALPKPPPSLVTNLAGLHQRTLHLLPSPQAVDAAIDARDRVEIVGWKSPWKMLRGSQARQLKNAEWTVPEFDDRAWETVSLPVGYGDGDRKPATTLVDMKGRYTTVLLRRKFSLPPGTRHRVVFETERNCGFIAWINGREFYRTRLGACRSEILPHQEVNSKTYSATVYHGEYAVDPSFLEGDQFTLSVLLATDGFDEESLRASFRLVGYRRNPESDLELRDLPIHPSISRDSAVASYLSARLFERAGQLSEAGAIYEQLLEGSPNDLEIAARAVDNARRRNDEPRAVKIIDATLARARNFPDDRAEFLRNRAWIKLRLGRQDFVEYLTAAVWTTRADAAVGLLSPVDGSSSIAFVRLGLPERALRNLEIIRTVGRGSGTQIALRDIGFLSLALFESGNIARANQVFDELFDESITTRRGSSPYMMELARKLGRKLKD